MTRLSSVAVAFPMVLAAIPAAAEEIEVEKIKSEGAWCGGSYHTTGGLMAEQFYEAREVPARTNFGECVPVERKVMGGGGERVGLERRRPEP